MAGSQRWTIWAVAGVLVGGCGGSVLKKCATDGDCGSGAHCDRQLCVLDQPGGCGATFCTTSQRCTAAKSCVTDLPPTLTISSPGDGTEISSDTLEISG